MKIRSHRRASLRRRPLSAERLEERRVLAYSHFVLGDNPLGYWKMDETSGTTLIDSAPNGGAQNGTYGGAPIFGQPTTFAEAGTSVRLDPADGADFARINNVAIGQSFTFEIWARSATDNWNNNGWIANDRGANGFLIHPDAGGKSWRGFVVDAGGTLHAIGTHTPASINGWHQYVVSFDASTNTGRMYFDGQLVATSAAGIAASRTGGNINIDLGQDDADVFAAVPRPGDGWLDEASLYNTALTGAQILAHYNARTNAEIVSQPGFETPAQPGATWEQANGTGGGTLDGTHWTFSGGAGISRNGSAFGSNAPEGVQVALIQTNTGTSGFADQRMANLIPGRSYVMTVSGAVRPGNSSITYRLLVDGQQLDERVVTTTAFSNFVSAPFVATSTTAQLRVMAVNQVGGDQTLFFDNVRINDIPQGVTDNYTVAEDGSLTVPAPGVLANDGNQLGGSLTAALVSGVQHGTLSFNPNGSFTYTPTPNYFGPDSFVYTASDGQFTSDPVTVNLSVTNVEDDPVASAGGPYSIVEGQSLTLNGSASDNDGETLTIGWDLNGDDNFSDATTVNATLTWAQLAAFGIADNGNFTIRMRATDPTNRSATSSATLTVNNTAPTVSISGPEAAALNQPLTFTFSISDPSSVDQAANALYEIDWEDDGIIDETLSRPANGFSIDHVYTTAGEQTIRVVAYDKDGGSDEATHVVDVGAAFTDEEGTLHVGGTPGNDRIHLAFNGGVVVRINNRLIGKFSATEKIVVFAGDGADTVTVAGNVPFPLEVYGGAGNDYLTGGPKADILDGGEDNDRINGGAGNDEIYGGDGNDTLAGGNGHDMLDGGDGNDLLNAGGGNDVLWGGAGKDRLNGGLGDDVLIGGEGDDHIDGGAGHDILSGGGGSDKLYGRAGRDLLIGGLAGDSLYGGAGDDLIIGDAVDIEEDVDELIDALALFLSQSSSGDVSLYFNDVSISPLTPDVLYGEGGNDRFIGVNDDLIRDKRSGDIVDLFEE